ncbi:MAG: CRISPR-associated ring nuclease Csm6 [Leptospirales bacterium]
MDTPRKRILVCMTGTSPQVVTETLYALACRSDPFVPEHLVLMSTIEGAELARKTLLDPQTGWLWRLCREIALPLSPEKVSLVCLRGRDGEPLPDIRSVEENEDAADAILGAIRNITSDPATEVHVSLSGGRKTMGFYAGYALSLYGRPQDRLSHVLVSPPFEYTPEFFYPAGRPGEILIPLRSGEVVDAHAARVTLAEIPVVHLRHALPPPLLEGPGSFTDAVRAAQRAVRPPELVIDIQSRRIRAHDVVIPLAPALLAFLVWLAEARFLRKESLTCPKERPPNKLYAAAYLEVYNRIKGVLGGTERTAERLAKGMDKGFFEETLSKLNRSLRDALGEDVARHYRIEGSGRRWKSYSLPLSEKDVRFEALISS